MAKQEVIYLEELFASIQGESTDSGKPCVFIRLFGCNIGCSYCDQKQTTKSKWSIQSIVSKVQGYHIPNVCITGGEPLLQWDSVYQLSTELTALGYEVSIETSGCIKIEDTDLSYRKYKYIMDVKCPSSGVSYKNVLENLMHLSSKDEVKFVIANEEDYLYARKILRSYPTSAKILFSPCFDEDLKPMIGKELVDWVLRDRLLMVRFQIQLHKCLGVK